MAKRSLPLEKSRTEIKDDNRQKNIELQGRPPIAQKTPGVDRRENLGNKLFCEKKGKNRVFPNLKGCGNIRGVKWVLEDTISD